MLVYHTLYLHLLPASELRTTLAGLGKDDGPIDVTIEGTGIEEESEIATDDAREMLGMNNSDEIDEFGAGSDDEIEVIESGNEGSVNGNGQGEDDVSDVDA